MVSTKNTLTPKSVIVLSMEEMSLGFYERVPSLMYVAHIYMNSFRILPLGLCLDRSSCHMVGYNSLCDLTIYILLCMDI